MSSDGYDLARGLDALRATVVQVLLADRVALAGGPSIAPRGPGRLSAHLTLSETRPASGSAGASRRVPRPVRLR